MFRGHGLRLFDSPNGVVLARAIPVDCITGIDPLTRAAEERLPQLRAAFKLAG